MSAYLRAKRAGIRSGDVEPSNDSLQSRVAGYLMRNGSDERRMKWNFERAAEALSKELDDIEIRIMSAARFAEPEEDDLLARRLILMDDFEFLYCVAMLFAHQNIDGDKARLAECLGVTAPKKGKKT